MNHPASARYREMEVLALPPARRLVLLFSHMQLTLQRAKLHVERNEIEPRAARIVQAQDILQELLVTLDRDAGGELAQRLAEIYRWLFSELSRINVRPEASALDRVIRVVAELHEAWDAAAAQQAAPVVPGLS